MFGTIWSFCKPVPDKFPLHTAVRCGNVAKVNEFLKTSIDLNTLNDDSYTPLEIALLNRTDVITIRLLEAGVLSPTTRKVVRMVEPIHWSITDRNLSLLILLAYFVPNYKEVIHQRRGIAWERIREWDTEQPDLKILNHVKNADACYLELRSLLDKIAKSENQWDKQAELHDKIAQIYYDLEQQEVKMQKNTHDVYCKQAMIAKNQGNLSTAEELEEWGKSANEESRQAFVEFYRRKGDEYSLEASKLRKKISSDQLSTPPMELSRLTHSSPIDMRHRVVGQEMSWTGYLSDHQNLDA